LRQPKFEEENMRTLLSKRSAYPPIIVRLLILVMLLQGTGLPQSYQQCTISNGLVNGFFGGATVSGTFTLGATPNTSNITVIGAANSAYQWSYTFTGPLDGPNYTQTSKIPAAPCIIEGCSPGSTVGPGDATLSVYEANPNAVSLGFEDTGEVFSGAGTLSCKTVGSSSPPPPPETCGVADPVWSQMAWTGLCPPTGPATITDAGYVRGQRINVNWQAPFPTGTSLTSVLGEKLEMWCGAMPGSNTYQYLLFFTALNDTPHVVGFCEWMSGCNLAWYSYSSVVAGPEGPAPGCFQNTTWISKDYGANDDAATEHPPLLDWYVETFSANTLNLTVKDYQFLYQHGPPVAMCPAIPMPEGKLVNTITVRDPTIGVATDAFVLSQMDLLASQPPGVSAPSNLSLADINGDGLVNMADFVAFQKAFGSCSGQPNYNLTADLDFDGCVTLKDYQIWLQFYNSATPH
jgi:hypothetical protein